MKNIIEKVIDEAKKLNKTIVLTEASDERVLKAARIITDEKIAKIILVSDREDVLKCSKKNNISLEGLTLIDPKESENYDNFVEFLYNLRKEKGMTLEAAKKYVLDPMYFGTIMVKKGLADGLVSGATHTTSDTLRPALQIIKAKADAKVVSSFFLMEIPNSKYEKEYIFSDCGLIPNPNKDELAEIAIESSRTYELLIKKESKVALLSFSTLGSSSRAEEVIKLREALEIVKDKKPDLLIDGELQLDAAIDKNVAEKKAKGSKVAGQANTLIFPNLDAGNIGYKLVERFAMANAYGPITQGLAKPVNDLSRGCKTEDIVGTVAITCVQAN